MKKVLVCLALTAVFYVGATYVLGAQVRDRYFASLQEVGDTGLVNATNVSYERGVFSSRARTQVRVGVPQAGGETAEKWDFVVTHVFRHGPVTMAPQQGILSARPGLALASSTIESGPEGENALLTQFPELAETTSTIRVHFDGSVAGDFLVPALDRKVGAESLGWAGLQGSVDFDPALRHLRARLIMPGLNVRVEDETLSVQNMTCDMDMSETLPLLYVGEVSVDIASITAEKPGEQAAGLESLRLVSDSRIEGALVHSNQTLDITRILAAGQTHGPLRCELETRNLNARSLSDFQVRIRELYRAERDPDRMAERMGNLYGRLLRDLLTGNPEFRIPRLHLATAMGNATGSMSVRLDAPGESALGNPLLLLGHLDATAEASVHEALVQALMRGQGAEERPEIPATGLGGQDLEALLQQQRTDQINALISRNLLIRDGDTLRARAEFNQGRLTVNGLELSLF
jgi:uncharacterized protein YdgA (DUF945 family)